MKQSPRYRATRHSSRKTKGQGERVWFRFAGGGERAMTRSEIPLHRVNHTTNHWGFVADRFCQVPGKAPVTDLLVYLREERAMRALPTSEA